MTVVFKLGGSLLTQPGLANALKDAIGQRSSENCLIVIGGGATANVVRDWSRIHGLDDETAHWLAMSSMDLNRQLLQGLLDWRSISTQAAADECWSIANTPLLVEMTKFTSIEESNGRDSVPHDWNVTSDSIAAWVAVHWPANELILLKSVSAPVNLSAETASRDELVDPYFPRIAAKISRISWCNLRASPAVIVPWLSHGSDQTV